MIPKTIHYCWFSGEEKPRTIQRCIDSWKKIMPDYTIKCWDANSFDFDSVPYVKQAMELKRYASASDYVRLYALFTEGGIYLDSDVLVQKPFDSFLSNDFFCGTETYGSKENRLYRLEAAILGAQKENPFVRDCMSFYKENNFSLEREGKDIVMPVVISKVAEKYGYRYDNALQTMNGITVYPTSVFSNMFLPEPSVWKNNYAIHQNFGSWFDFSNRGVFFRFCKRFDLMKLYYRIENMLR